MKKILKPFTPEQSVYYSDFSGKCFGEFPPEATVTFDFSYGSTVDGETIEFHLSTKEALEVIQYMSEQIKDRALKINTTNYLDGLIKRNHTN